MMPSSFPVEVEMKENEKNNCEKKENKIKIYAKVG